MCSTDHSRATTTMVATSGQHMCHVSLCTDQQWPAYSVFTVQSHISPSPLCCEVESVERKTVWRQHWRQGVNRVSHSRSAWLRDAGWVRSVGWHLTPHYLLLNSLKGNCQEPVSWRCGWKNREVRHTCWKLLIEGKRVPVHCDGLCQEMVGTVGTTPVREGNRVRLCSDWQKDWLYPISCCFQNVPSSQFG